MRAQNRQHPVRFHPGLDGGLGDPAAGLSDRHQHPQPAVGGHRTEIEVRAARVLAEFKHVAEHRDLASRARRFPHRVERCLHRRHVRVVAIIDEARAVPEDLLHAHLRILDVFQAFANLVEVHALHVANRRGLERVVNLMAAKRLEPDDHVVAFLGNVETELDVAVDLDVAGPDVREIFDAHRHDRRARPGPQLVAPLIVGVEDREAVAVVRQILQRRSLLFRHAGLVTEKLDVREPDVGDDTDVRPHHFREHAHLAGMIRAELEHAEVVRVFHREQAERGADVVVMVRRRLDDVEALR